MVVCIKDKVFSGLLVKNNPNEIIIHLKPFDKNTFVSISNGQYSYKTKEDIL